MERGLPDSSSSYADEGTAAHFLLSESLSKGVMPRAFFSKTIAVTSDGAHWHEPEIMPYLPTAFYPVDDDMIGHIESVVNLVRQYAEGGELLAEQELPIGHITGEDGATGTGDIVVLLPTEILIGDLKYGMGNEVSAIENDQLIMYGAGALKKYDLGTFETVRMVIFQPRISTLPSEYVLTVDEINARIAVLGVCASQALMILAKVEAGGKIFPEELHASESTCKWCKAKATCPALAARVQADVGADFEVLAEAAQHPKAAENVKSLVEAVDAPLLSLKMKAVGMVEDWCKAVRARVEGLLLGGVAVPDFKLVQGRKGARAWNDADDAEKTMKSMHLKHDQMYTYKIITPTKAEELLKDISPIRWKKLALKITQADGKPSVAPSTDKRPALVIAPVTDEFTETGGDLV